jgi:hypothetical protein
LTALKEADKDVEVSLPQEAKLKSVVVQLGLLIFWWFQVQILVHKLRYEVFSVLPHQ